MTWIFCCPVFHPQLPSMGLDDVITQTQSQSCTLSGRFGGEERLKDFVFDGVGNAGTIVGDGDFYPPAPSRGVVETVTIALRLRSV